MNTRLKSPMISARNKPRISLARIVGLLPAKGRWLGVCRIAIVLSAAFSVSAVMGAADTPADESRPAGNSASQTDAPAKSPRDAGANSPDDKEAARQAARQALAREPETRPSSEDLRALIGVNPQGLKRVEVPRIPAMSLRGFVHPHGREPMALLEIGETNRLFLVKVGAEIPVTVSGRVSPVGRAALQGLGESKPANSASARSGDDREQSQIILKVLRITSEGVTVETGQLSQTMVIR